MALRLKFKTETLRANRAKVYWDSEACEYVVKFYIAGKHYCAGDYYTDDLGDACATALEMIAQAARA